jgi:hypothetical protein
MSKQKNKSVALLRRVQCYPSPHYHTLVKEYAKKQEMSISDIACEGIKLFFDNIPACERQELLKNKSPKK